MIVRNEPVAKHCTPLKLVAGRHESSPLHAAVLKGDTRRVSELAARGTDMNAVVFRNGADWCTAAYYAARSGCLPTLTALASAGADLGAPCHALNGTIERTPAFYVVAGAVHTGAGPRGSRARRAGENRPGYCNTSQEPRIDPGE